MIISDEKAVFPRGANDVVDTCGRMLSKIRLSDVLDFSIDIFSTEVVLFWVETNLRRVVWITGIKIEMAGLFLWPGFVAAFIDGELITGDGKKMRI